MCISEINLFLPCRFIFNMLNSRIYQKSNRLLGINELWNQFTFSSHKISILRSKDFLSTVSLPTISFQNDAKHLHDQLSTLGEFVEIHDVFLLMAPKWSWFSIDFSVLLCRHFTILPTEKTVNRTACFPDFSLTYHRYPSFPFLFYFTFCRIFVLWSEGVNLQ